jgi:NAD(P)-dependent dehydrogenase (short-subunit alcohol dehydrogenase family)
MAQALQYRKEAITVNCLCPGVVPSGLMPQTVIDNMPPELVTWPSTMVKAINQFLADDSITGEAAECSGTDVIYRPAYKPENEAAKFMTSGAAFASVDFAQIQQHTEEKAKHYTIMEKAVAVTA